jgi:2-C-methyl-D-erythritol 4-phosphate cytidylyltransferase
LPDRRVLAVVVAAGAGARFGASLPKQFAELEGRPVALWALSAFLAHPAVDGVIAVVPAAEADRPPEWLGGAGARVVAGGRERADSVRAGLDAAADSDVVLIHDGARPLVPAELISRVLGRVEAGTGVVPALPLTDTVKEVDERGTVARTLPRERLRRVQTPQGFMTDELRRAYARAAVTGFRGTDDAAVFAHAGGRVLTVAGEEETMKITHAADLAVAAALLSLRIGAP